MHARDLVIHLLVVFSCEVGWSKDSVVTNRSGAGSTAEVGLIGAVRNAKTNAAARIRAIGLLGEMRSTNAVPVLIKHLTLDDPAIKSYPAVAALCNIGTNAVQALKSFVLNAKAEDQYREISHAAAVLRMVLGDAQTDRWVEGCKSNISHNTYQILMSNER